MSVTAGQFQGIAGAVMPPAPPGQIAPGQAPLDQRILAGTAVPQPDGGMEIMLGEPESDMASLPFDANLAEYLDLSVLRQVSTVVLDGIEADHDSNDDYFEEIEQVIKLLALSPEVREAADKPFAAASDSGHPMMLEAVVRFVANGRSEMLPADGPARSKINATPAQPAEGLAQRRVSFVNYHLTAADRDYYRDFECGLLWLAIYGSVFRKPFRDPVTREVRSRYLTPAHLLVSFHAPSVAEADRVTHIDTISAAVARRRQLSGYYREGVSLGGNDGSAAADQPAERARQVGDRRRPSDRTEDAEHVHYHCHCWLTLADTQFEHLGNDGEPDGAPMPFIVTVDEHTREVLRIERDWLPTDPFCRRKATYVHYLFHPGIGFYGLGLGALMRASTEQATALWRLGVDTMTLNAFPGGFLRKGLRLENSRITMGPGEFVEIDTGGSSVRESVMSLGEVYKDVPPSWAPLFASAVEQGQKLGMTTEMQVGEGRQDAPVGSTLALIEQAARPMAAVFKRLHHAMAEELRLLCALFASDPEAKYPYAVDGQPGMPLAPDFADVDDVIPVSDPNQPTQIQRLALAQALLSLAQASGGLLDQRAIYASMLQTMGKTPQEIAALMPQPGQGQPADVATEFAKALKQMPLSVGPAQDHLAHAKVHVSQMQTPGLPPPVASALLAHVGDHVAAWYALQAQAAMAQAGMPPQQAGQPMTPQVDAAMAQAVAANSDGIMAKLAQAFGGMQADPSKAAELDLKRQELAYKREDSERKAEQNGRQDQTELLKLREQSADAAAERALREHEIHATAATEIARAGAALLHHTARPVGQA